MLVCFDVARSDDWAMLNAEDSDMRLFTGGARCLSLQVDKDVHKVGTGLEHFRICGVAALRRDHR
jgi:hypothetical protein